MSLLESVDARVADERKVTVVGVPIDTDEYVLERAMRVMRDGGAERLARCLADMPNKKAAALIAIEPLAQRTSYIERALDTGLPSKLAGGQIYGAQRARQTKIELPGGAESLAFLQAGCPDEQAGCPDDPPTLRPHQQAQPRLSTGAEG